MRIRFQPQFLPTLFKRFPSVSPAQTRDWLEVHRQAQEAGIHKTLEQLKQKLRDEQKKYTALKGQLSEAGDPHGRSLAPEELRRRVPYWDLFEQHLGEQCLQWSGKKSKTDAGTETTDGSEAERGWAAEATTGTAGTNASSSSSSSSTPAAAPQSSLFSAPPPPFPLAASNYVFPQYGLHFPYVLPQVVTVATAQEKQEAAAAAAAAAPAAEKEANTHAKTTPNTHTAAPAHIAAPAQTDAQLQAAAASATSTPPAAAASSSSPSSASSALSAPPSSSARSSSQPVCVVVGVGPGLGAAVAQRFARAGFAVACCARSKDKLEEICEEINEALEDAADAATANAAASSSAVPAQGYARAFQMDCTVEQEVKDAFAEIRAQLGPATTQLGV
jgi:hypothetical protein